MSGQPYYKLIPTYLGPIMSAKLYGSPRLKSIKLITRPSNEVQKIILEMIVYGIKVEDEIIYVTVMDVESYRPAEEKDLTT